MNHHAPFTTGAGGPPPAALPGTEIVAAFTNARNVRITNSSFNLTATVNTTHNPVLDSLFQRVAPNAISNEGGRADVPRCHPGTREEVIGLIEAWADDANAENILWMSGPAGGGKTAIMKTISERSRTRGVQTINFFFFRGDTTRNGLHPVIATLLYQIFELYPASVQLVAEIIAGRPRILDGTLAEQCTLISSLIPSLRRSLLSGASIILLIDGLDECDVDAERAQASLLGALEGLVAVEGYPFRLLVASRPEGHIQMAFNQLSSRARTIFLDEKYSPREDIRHFIVAEFEKIKSSHPLAQSLPQNWPATSDVDDIVSKSSGQFIYAATVMRCVAHPTTVPSLSLDRIRGVALPATNSPFAHLDSMYTSILSRASDPQFVRDMMFLATLRRHDDDVDEYGVDDLAVRDDRALRCYDPRYTQAAFDSCVAELSSIVKFNSTGRIEFFHASFLDFLQDKSRAGQYCVDRDVFTVRFLVALWKHEGIKGWLCNFQLHLLASLTKPNPKITRLLLDEPPHHWTSFGGDVPQLEYWIIIHRLYHPHDLDVYKTLVHQSVQRVFSQGKQDWLFGYPQIMELPFVEGYFVKSYDDMAKPPLSVDQSLVGRIFSLFLGI